MNHHRAAHKRHYFGDDAPAAITVAKPTVTGSVSGLVHLALSPVKWGLKTVGSVVCWAGDTVTTISNKL